MSESALSRKYIDGIYVPVVLLIFGVFIVKREYTLYAAAVGLAFGTVKFFNLRMFPPSLQLASLSTLSPLTNTRPQSPRRSSPTPAHSSSSSSRRRPSSPTMSPCTYSLPQVWLVLCYTPSSLHPTNTFSLQLPLQPADSSLHPRPPHRPAHLHCRRPPRQGRQDCACPALLHPH